MTSVGKLFNIIFRGFRPSRARNASIPRSPYRDGRFKTTSHAIKQMRARNISKGALHINLHTRAIKTRVRRDSLNRPSYRRITQNQIVSAINPNNNNINSVWSINKNRYNSYARRYGNKKYGK